MSECHSCKFWRDLHDQWAGKGQCRRYPPVVEYRDRSGDHAWPETTREKWCGEYAPKDQSHD